MRRFVITTIAAVLLTAALYAGGFALRVDPVNTSPEARAQHAVLLAHITACVAPEKTTVTATAEGIVNGKRASILLKVVKLAEPGAFAVAREWPQEGEWVIKMVATHPQLGSYATGIVAPVAGGEASPVTAKIYYHAPTPDEVAGALKHGTLE
ncbi:MAG TPA: hypothetical protein VKB79_13845 [Bryobacteraceae bacterium]|nr:hypothetical protein [Bryobacteraceae bacterium]